MKDILLLAGRLALVALYIESAIGKFAGLGGVGEALSAAGYPAPLFVATISAAGELAGALGVAAGLFTRIAALGLLVYTVLATLTFHNFWAYDDVARASQHLQFMKNLGLTGGMLIVAATGPGRFSLDAWWRQRGELQVKA